MNKKQFFYLLNNALKITFDDSIFYVWNKSIDRQLKYNRIFNRNIPIKYEFNKKDVFFEQNMKNIWYDYDKIYLKLQEKSEYEKLDISDLIEKWVVNDNKWNKYNYKFIKYTYSY
jgi:hypothetical protein